MTRSASDKLGGNRLGRFAGFLKESWRINDWTWAAGCRTTRCRVVLDPRRVRRTHRHVEGADPAVEAAAFVDTLVGDLFHGSPPGSDFADLVEEVKTELENCVFDPDRSDLPPTLTHLADLFAWAIQADVAAEELPALRLAVDADVRNGATAGSAGMRFVEENAALLDRLSQLPRAPRPGPLMTWGSARSESRRWRLSTAREWAGSRSSTRRTAT